MELRKGLIISGSNFVGKKIERKEYEELTPATEGKEKASFEALVERIKRVTGMENFVTLEELQRREELRPIYTAIGSITSPLGLKVELWGVAPPEGENWSDIIKKIKQGQPFSLWVAIVGHQISASQVREEETEASQATAEVEEEERAEELAKARRKEGLETVTVLSAQLVTFEPVKTERGETVWVGEYNPATAKSVWVRDTYLSLEEGRRRGISTPEEAEELREEFDFEVSEGEAEVTSLEELEAERKKEEEKREREERREEWQSLAEYFVEHAPSHSLLKEVLLRKLDELLTGIFRKGRKWATALLRKSKEEEEDIAAAKRKLDEGLKALSEGNGLEALEDFAAARFYLFDCDCYREPLVNAFDDLMDIAWRAYKGKKVSKERARQLVSKIKDLMENPRGEMAEPPRRVKTVRDARLWEMAKRIVKDEYKDVEEDSEQYWALVSRIFTRMKLRLGGLSEEKVEKIVEELREKYGKLPSPEKAEEIKKKVMESEKS